MSSTSPRPYILVGIDGSAAALHALTWAADEAQRRNLPLRLAHSVDYGAFAGGFNPGFSASFYEHLDADASEFLAQARDQVAALNPHVEVSESKLKGRPALALAELSRCAFMTVLGSSGLGGLSGLVAGSVSVSLTAHGHSPVVVVRAPGTPLGGPIVLGVSASGSSEDATSWAFEEASLRGVPLIAVHVWNEIPPGALHAYAAWSELDWSAEEKRQAVLLAERLERWQEKFPDVKVRHVIGMGNTAEVLLRHARHAQLIVVGSRGRGDVAGFFLGSISHALIHHAPCPVLVARAHSHEEK